MVAEEKNDSIGEGADLEKDAAEKESSGSDMSETIVADGDDLEAEMAAQMAAESLGSDEDDLEAQMAAAMGGDDSSDDDGDLEAQMAAAMGGGGGESDDLLGGFADEVESEATPVQPVNFSQLTPSDETTGKGNIDRLMDVGLNLSVELGRKDMQIREILSLGPGKIIELDKLTGEPVDLLVNGKLLAKGEVVVVDENFGVRITELVDPVDRIKLL